MTAGLTMRTSMPDDRAAILDLVRDAFSDDDRDGREEVDIVVSTWKSGASPPDFELVAVENTTLVGHVLAAWGRLAGREVAAVAPLAVTPTRQGVGIGIALMTEMLRRFEEAELPLVLLLGYPGYYGRFGFEPSGPLDISYRLEHNPHFLVRRFSAYDPSYRGDFTYCWEIATA